MQTQFFGEFAKKEANQQRLEYAQSRFGALLALMSEAKIQPLYCDVATVAHMSGKGADYRHEQLVRAAAKSFQLRGPLSENQEPFDFLLRVSRVIDPDYFSSIWLAMYQERVFELIQPPGSVPPQPMVMFDWQGALMDEGLELRYERNNKRALWAGRVETGTEFAMKLVTSGISGFPTALDVVERALLENL
jgi:hypothetical protein